MSLPGEPDGAAEQRRKNRIVLIIIGLVIVLVLATTSQQPWAVGFFGMLGLALILLALRNYLERQAIKRYLARRKAAEEQEKEDDPEQPSQ